jgi:hypothetical protein
MGIANAKAVFQPVVIRNQLAPRGTGCEQLLGKGVPVKCT